MTEIMLSFTEERTTFGRRDYRTLRYKTIEAGETFAVWHTSEQPDGSVLFAVEKSPFCHCTAEDFVVRRGETVPFTCSQRYECAEDCIEDITEGTAQLV